MDSSTIDPSLLGLTEEIQDATTDIFADIDWPEDNPSLGFDHNQCLDCLLTPQATCPACAIFVPEMKDEVENPKDCDSYPTPSSSGQQTSTATDGSPASNEASAAETTQSSGRFSKEIRSILRVWYNQNKNNPYPSNEEKDELARRTGLKRGQISLWLANTRRRHRARKQAAADTNRAEEPYENLNPFDRWKILPVDQEATPYNMIEAAALTSSLPGAVAEPAVSAEYPQSQFAPEQSTTTLYDNFFSQSMASYDTAMTSMINGSSISDSTFLSYAPTTNSGTSHLRDRRRRKHHAPKSQSSKSTGGKERPFQCTFCVSHFATKYDWARHEKSQHMSLEKWTCCLGGGILYTSEYAAKCAFCAHPDPDTAHLETHHYSACEGKPLLERTFYRKDHFFQHLRLTHDAKYVSHMEVWKSEQNEIASRCGFCNATFTTWAARSDHLASHFKCHADMKDWKGDLGFEQHVLAKVEKLTRDFGVQTKLAKQFALPELPRSCYDIGMGTRGSIPGLSFPFDAGGQVIDTQSTASTLGNSSFFDGVDTSDSLSWAF